MIFVPYGPPTCHLMGQDTDGTGMPTSKGWEVEVEPIAVDDSGHGQDRSRELAKESGATPATSPRTSQPRRRSCPAWEEIETGRYMPRRIRGSFRGRELG